MRTIDALDRVTFIDYPGSALDTTHTYDAPGSFMKGRLRSIQRQGSTLTFGYDRFGRTTGDGPMSYQYDDNGNRTRVSYPLGVAVLLTYDAADRPATLTLRPGFEPQQPIVTAAAYEPFGPVGSVTLANGLTETREYDRRYGPTGIAVGALLDWDYGTDDVGNVTAIADALNPSGNRTFGYQDVQYFLTSGTGPWGSLSWDYDRIGNRLTEKRDATTDTYDYVLNGTGNTPILSTIELGAGGTRKYTYDAAGDLTRIVEGAERLRLTYDAERRIQGLDPQATFPKDEPPLRRAQLPALEPLRAGCDDRPDDDAGLRLGRDLLPQLLEPGRRHAAADPSPLRPLLRRPPRGDLRRRRMGRDPGQHRGDLPLDRSPRDAGAGDRRRGR